MKITCPKCGSPKAVIKTYVGSTETYNYCPEMTCLHTWGGEETPAKKALIAAACQADISEQNEVEGEV